jgi:hypothetical protein
MRKKTLSPTPAAVAANAAQTTTSSALAALTRTPRITDPGELAFANPDA